jgi:uncharacterized protein YdeI (YjbR/CyaY-like superfamily)
MVEVLLCFGWIDGRANRLDDHFYLQRVTPRRAKSVWSQKNVETVERLIAAGGCGPPGWPRWKRRRPTAGGSAPTAAPRTRRCPTTSPRPWTANPELRAEFDSLDSANRYAILWRVQTAATPATRAKRIAAAVELLRDGRRIH